MHYQFAESLFTKTIKNILPPESKLEIRPLEEIPFFNYMISYLESRKYEHKPDSFSKRYTEITKSNFEFDCNYHKKLKERAVERIETNTVCDLEINKEGGGDVDDLRLYVLEENIPFQIIGYSNTINKIFIDEKILAEKIKYYNPRNSYRNIKPSVISALIDRKITAREKEEQLFLNKISESNLEIGDYIFVEDKNIANSNQNIGIIKGFSLSYNNDLDIKYNVIKKDFTESKLPLKEIKSSDISFILKREIFNEEIINIKLRTQLIRLFKERGIKKKIVTKTSRKSK